MRRVAWLMGFNSMKVRLRLEQAQCVVLADAFQFHEGPIKTCAVRFSLP